MVIVGGGFSGAAAAIQLARAAASPLAITIVEPRATLGAGLAYSADDPDHRINGTIDSHLVDPADPGALRRWCERTGLLERDPEAVAPSGSIFIRRGDFGRFVADEVRSHAQGNANGTTIRHCRDSAVGVARAGMGLRIETRSGEDLDADAVVVATGNGAPRTPPGFGAELDRHPGFVRDALRTDRIRTLPADARVLVAGSGLTALDVISTLLRQRHRGEIVVVSRHGLRPSPQRPPNPDGSGARLMARIDGPVPAFVTAAGNPPTTRGLVRVLRHRIAHALAQGDSWYVPFDDLRDVVWQVWPLLPPAEKRRFLARLRPFYDAARFRTPPQNEAMVAVAEAEGRVVYRRARLRGASELSEGGFDVSWVEPGLAGERSERFDAIVNCTGLDPSCGAADNPFLASLVSNGMLRRDATGIGFEVDRECRPLGRDGEPEPGLRVIGPPTAGTFGDPLGVLFITPQIRRMLPGLLRDPRSQFG